MRSGRVVIGIVTLVLVVAACGDDDDTAVPPGSGAEATTANPEPGDDIGDIADRPDSCELITQEEFETFIEDHATEQVVVEPVEFGCGYDLLFEFAGGTYVQFDTHVDDSLDFYRTLHSGDETSDVDRLGDDAVYSEGIDINLYVLDDGVVYQFVTAYELSEPLGFADDQSCLVAVAELVLS